MRSASRSMSAVCRACWVSPMMNGSASRCRRLAPVSGLGHCATVDGYGSSFFLACRRTISSTTRVIGAVASTKMPFLGMSSFV